MSRTRGRPLTERLGALREAVELAGGRVDTLEARTLLDKAGARTALGDSTVVALAGSTGSGKSTLFNALAGAQLSDPGVRRPTTGVAHAATWGGEPGPLLDWLQVPRRHAVDQDPATDKAFDGLVLLDLPDHDSTRLENRLEVERLVELVDVLVWVMDPQKYADAAVHDRYLKPYTSHAGVLLVVLNQVDRLAEPQPVLADLRGLLDAEGLSQVPVVGVSARTGAGLDVLRRDLADRVAKRRAANDRLAADVSTTARGLQAHCGGAGGAVGKQERRALVAALGDAAGVPTVTAAVERSSRKQAATRTGWPLVRWVGKLRPDPLERLHLGAGATSLPVTGGVEQARVTNALRTARDAVGADLPVSWRDSLREVVDARQATLAPALDRAVSGTELPTRAPRWWGAVGALQALLLVAALVGALWLFALVGLAYLQLDDVVPLPRVERIPLPTLLLVCGLLAGALLAVVVRPLTRVSARRRGRRAEKALLERVEQVAQTELFAPLEQEREAYTAFCRAVGLAV
ncbi:MAG: GTP-binding protein HSR1-related protein [Frankiales bacterium]|nr:GTP-binding protein HSR1-related protein [Frankiales bacterium]